ncbi:hypothetical protein DAI22_11g219100 [Oryza sativa Japonica Group]|jgi:hypothetical protein|nr:hypothetical protein DAI22_11g219100 [Oryza sativa Japonica Group]
MFKQEGYKVDVCCWPALAGDRSEGITNCMCRGGFPGKGLVLLGRVSRDFTGDLASAKCVTGVTPARVL